MRGRRGAGPALFRCHREKRFMAQGHVFTLKILFFEKRGDNFIPLVQMFVLVALMVLFLLYENINLSAKAEIIFA